MCNSINFFPHLHIRNKKCLKINVILTRLEGAKRRSRPHEMCNSINFFPHLHIRNKKMFKNKCYFKILM